MRPVMVVPAGREQAASSEPWVSPSVRWRVSAGLVLVVNVETCWHPGRELVARSSQPTMKRSAQPDNDPSLGSVDPAVQPALAFPDPDWNWFVQRCAALDIAGAE